VNEAEERELWDLVCAAFDAKGTDEFEDRIRAIEQRWLPRYEFWLLRSREKQSRKKRTA
jgi:hypothetical protein